MKKKENAGLADRRLILAIDAGNLNGMAELMGQFVTIEELQRAGVIATSVEPLVGVCEFLADCGVWFGPRRYLEGDPNWRQLIPYVVLARTPPVTEEDVTYEQAGMDREIEYLAYRRAGHIEEQRLANRMSIGWGGHIDLPDCRFNQMEELSLRETVLQSTRRELNEECGLVGRQLEPFGLIISDDETGQVHVGLVLIAEVLGTIEAKEDLQLELEWLTAQEIVDRDEGQEGWTSIVAKELAKLSKD